MAYEGTRFLWLNTSISTRCARPTWARTGRRRFTVSERSERFLASEIIRKISDHQAMMINRTRAGMLVLGGDTLYTLEVNPAVYVTLAANEAEKHSPIRIVGLGAEGAVGRLRLAGGDAEIDEAVKAVERALKQLPGRANEGVD